MDDFKAQYVAFAAFGQSYFYLTNSTGNHSICIKFILSLYDKY